MTRALSLPADVPFPDRRLHLRRRSVGHLDREGELWATFLVTFQDEASREWRGYFAFRAVSEDRSFEREAQTGPLFIEASEAEITKKAKELGKPLLNGLLESALHMKAREDADSPFLRRWFQEVLVDNASRLSEEGQRLPDHFETPAHAASHTLEQLRSWYASYRLDQVCHFIALVKPEDFEFAVHRIFHESDGIDFAASDKLQLAMLVVDFIEARLPLPPFEVWVRDFLAARETYEIYSHALHREGILP